MAVNSSFDMNQRREKQRLVVAMSENKYGTMSESRTSAGSSGGDGKHVSDDEEGEMATTTTAYRLLSNHGAYLPDAHSWPIQFFLHLIFRRASPHSNSISTTKYTLLTFLPKNLFEQFHRYANIYFLLMVILSFIPAVEVFAKEVAPVPLLFVLSVTAVKDIFEDYSRYKSDGEVNTRPCSVYSR